MKKTIFLILLPYFVFSQEGLKIEPPFWWSNMKSKELQLLVYEKNISAYTPQIEGIPIKFIIRVQNPDYLFITIDTRNVKAGDYQIAFKKNGRVHFKKQYSFLKREHRETKGFDSSDVIYLLMPDRFANGNPDNDNQKDTKEKTNRALPYGRHGGDIDGIINHVEYLYDLGVTTIWCTPLLRDDEPEYSYHGYAQSDVYTIDPRFGSNHDYLRLSQALHEKGMKLIMDYVVNHWGKEHWIVKNPPVSDWLHQFPEYTNTNYEISTQYDSNASSIDKHLAADGWFAKSMPDINQNNPLTITYLKQNVIWWIEYAHLDGLRVDTYAYNDKESIANWTKSILDEYPTINIVGEVWLNNQAQISYWQKDSPIGAIQRYNSHCPSVMDFTLCDAFNSAFKNTEVESLKHLYDNFVNDFLYANPNNLLVFSENHDTQRFNQDYPNIEDYKLMLTLLVTVRGISQIYYGSEIGMKGEKSAGDGDIRQDFPGGWLSDKNNAFISGKRTPVQQDYHNFTSKLLNWRKKKAVIHFGKTTQFIPESNIYVYFRFNDAETVMVVVNNGTHEKILSLDRFNESLQGFDMAKDVISENKFKIGHSLTIPRKSSMILELRKATK